MKLLDDMALFVEVVKAMSFKGASDITGVPTSTLSRRVAGLEKSIGLRLLNRTTRKLELTEAGQLYFERCKHIIQQAQVAHEQLGDFSSQPSGVIRASLPVDFANVFMSVLIVEFAKTYPDILFEFDLTSREVDLVSEPFDVAIRIGQPKDSQLIARHLANFSSYLYASSRYLNVHGIPTHPNELVGHQCLTFPKQDVWRLQSSEALMEVSVGGKYVVNNVGMLKRLAVLDQGVVMLPEALVLDAVMDGQLQRVFPDWIGASIPVYALTETRLLPAKVRHFIDFIKDRLAC